MSGCAEYGASVTEPLPHPATGALFSSPAEVGAGWPGEVAAPETPVARTAAQVRRLAGACASLDAVDAAVQVCRACPRLVAWREDVAATKRAAFSGEPYWGRPASGIGPADARGLIVGLAPAANGANRTGRLFTGDASGDWLFASLHRVGLANQPTSTHAADGLEVSVRISCPVHCAPPANKPSPAELAACQPWLERELQLLEPTLQAVVALGAIAWQRVLKTADAVGWDVPRPAPKFGHGAEAALRNRSGHPVRLIGCYHVSQRNTSTGLLTEAMLDTQLAKLMR